MSEQDDVLALAKRIATDRDYYVQIADRRRLAMQIISLNAALTSPAASGVKLLSREPTEEMREASTATFREELASHRAHGVSGDAFMGPSGESYWQAMWDAALQSRPAPVIRGIDYGDSDRTVYHDGRGNEVDPPAPGVVQPANPEMLVLAKAAVDAQPDTRPVEQWANEWANDLARAPCDPAFGKINTSAQVFKSAPSQEGHAAGVASDVHVAPVSQAQGEKLPHLFYWEDAENSWCPADGLEVDDIVTTGIFLNDGDTINIRFKRQDMTQEEFDAIPEG